MRTIPLTKHHGLGNDFLVLSDVALADALRPDERAALARAACGRHTGVGADGLLFVLSAPVDGSADITMRLHNADGSVAEMSGNGIRCFAQAVVDGGLVAPGTVRVATDAGLRVVVGECSDAAGLTRFRVSMGTALVGALAVPDEAVAAVAAIPGVRRSVTVDVGNPHLVIEVAPEEFDGLRIAAVGPSVERAFLDGPTKGINVEVVRARTTDVLDMVVWERGVGVTNACGTGATATAIAAHAWGLVGSVSEVVQPGGSAGVEVHADGTATLIGPSQFICALSFAWGGA